MGRQLSAERKSKREINQTKRGEGWEGAREQDGGAAAFMKSLNSVGAGSGPQPGQR